MACTNPSYAFDCGINPDTGKRAIKFLPPRVDLYSREVLEARYGKGNIILLPCGKCLSCRISKSKEWAVRCVLEAKSYSSNYFLTLTFDNEHYQPEANKRPLQLFLKKLRKKYKGLRYFGCGEFGTETNRFHNHLILFNCDIKDLKFIGKSKNGPYFESEEIRNLWGNGHIMITEFSYNTAAYVARYTLKKILSDEKDGSYICMSTHPGIGANYFYENYKDIYDVDKVYGSFGKSYSAHPPRYFDKLLEVIDLEKFKEVKENRLTSNNVDELDYLIRHNLKHFEEAYHLKNEEAISKHSNKLKRRF